MRPADIDEKQRERLLDKYRKHRELGRMLFRDMIKYIPGDGLFKAAKKLGLTSGKTLVIGSDVEQAILVDYAFFNEYSGKFNAIDRYVNLKKPTAKEEIEFFSDMRSSFFSIFRITSRLPGFGFGVKDLMSGNCFSLVDVNLSESEYCPNVMTGRVTMFVKNCACSTGSLIPLRERSTIELVEQTANKYLRFAKSNTQPVFSNKHAASFQADVQRVQLKHNGLAGIAYK